MTPEESAGREARATMTARRGAQVSPSLQGTRGLDIFAIAGASISGWYPSYKTDGAGPARHPFTTQLEFVLGLSLEYHPWVRTYQRGDMSAAFAQAHRLSAPLGTPYPIVYTVAGEAHDYLPDWVGTLADGGLLVAEAGLTERKAQGTALAKADAARRWAQLAGGHYWLGTDDTLSWRRHWNLVFLHARRPSFPTYAEIAPAILPFLRGGEPVPVADLVRRLGPRWSEAEVEAAAWKIAAEAAAVGHLLVDLDAVEVRRDTPLALLDPDAPPILPPPLPTSLAPCALGGTPPPEGQPESESALVVDRPLPGPTVDAAAIPAEGQRRAFLRNLAAVTEVLAGASVRATARTHRLTPQRLSLLVRRARTLGQIALVPHRSYAREPALREEFRALIRKLYTRPLRPSVMAIAEDPALKRLAERLTEDEGRLVRLPS